MSGLGARRLALLLATLGAGALGLPAAAQADQYVVDHCRHPDGSPTTAFGTLTSLTANECGIPGGALRKHIVGTPGPGVGTHTYIGLEIPADRPNIRIERITTDWEVPGSTNTMFAFMAIYAHATPVDPTVYGSQPPLRTTVDAAMPPGTRGLSWDMYCGGGGGTCDFGAGTVSVVNVYGTRLYLNEGVDPTLEVTGGSLTGTGVKSGQMSVAFAGADTDSGVASASVSLGGTEVGSLQIACANNDWSACPRSVTGQPIAVDTRKVPDGNRDLVVTLRDAANNAVSRSLGAVTVSNAAGPAATAGVANGVGASRTAKLAARFTTTKKRSRTLRFTASPTIKGSLVDETGKPITGALVAVLARSRQAGADDVQIASATTGAEGGFSLKLPSGPSRTITFAYTAFSGDAKPATRATLKTTVRARISARIAPRSVRPGEAITLTGGLSLLPRKGVEVKIQARQGSKWRTIDDVRTTRTGSFRWPYRFSTRQARRTYAFRVRVASPIYPFAAASSKAVLVRVR